VDFVLRHGFPFVTFGRGFGEDMSFPWVNTDGASAFAEVLTLLRTPGHRHFGFAIIREHMVFRHRRTEGLRAAIEAKGDPAVRLTLATAPRYAPKRRSEVVLSAFSGRAHRAIGFRIGRIDHHRFWNRRFASRPPSCVRRCSCRSMFPTIAEGRGRTTLLGRVAREQVIAIEKDNPTQQAPIIGPLIAMAGRKEGSRRAMCGPSARNGCSLTGLLAEHGS
jgi:hypothetical protein